MIIMLEGFSGVMVGTIIGISFDLFKSRLFTLVFLVLGGIATWIITTTTNYITNFFIVLIVEYLLMIIILSAGLYVQKLLLKT